MKIEVFATRDELADAASDRMGEALERALAARGRAGMFLSGGSTPGPAYERLSNRNLDWERVTVGLADERWVDNTSDRSNEKLIRNTLLVGAAASADFLSMKTMDDTPAEAVETVNARYGTMDGLVDVLVLGMGSDGHVLSWFPQSEGLELATDPENPRLVGAIRAKPSDVTGENLDRMTLTANAVMQARHVFLLISGSAKRDVLENGADDLPVRTALKLAGERLEILWAD